MRTLKPSFILTFFCIFFLSVNMQGQNPLKKISKKLEKKAGKVIDEGLNGEEKKVEGKEEDKRVFNETGQGNSINRNFIDRSNTIFYDNFDSEKPGEFPSKWTQVNGTLENGQFVSKNKTEGVVQMVSNYTTFKPTFDTEDYLGDSFKIEFENYFWQKGNEAYVIQLHGAKSSAPAYSIYFRSTNVAPGSDNVVYLAGTQSPGWYTSQLSFNNGNLKVSVNGAQVVNNPDINIRAFTHVSIYTISPGSHRGDGYTKARINYFIIAKGGLPLYDRLVTNGRIVVKDIYFDEGKYVIKEGSDKALNEILTILREHENVEIGIEGHTNANGSNESNLVLSENRAEAVKNYFVENGIKSYRLSSKGYGEEKPIIPGNTEEASAQNRRVEFVLHQ